MGHAAEVTASIDIRSDLACDDLAVPAMQRQETIDRVVEDLWVDHQTFTGGQSETNAYDGDAALNYPEPNGPLGDPCRLREHRGRVCLSGEVWRQGAR